MQHSEKISLDELRCEIRNKVIKEVIPARYLDENTIIHINPCGLFIIGGPQVIFYLTLCDLMLKNDVNLSICYS